MIIQARFGAVQTGLGYQFYNAAGALIAPRVTGSSIIALAEAGAYLADAVVPGGAVGVYWNSTVSLAQATEDLREALAPSGGISAETAAALDAADQILLVALHTPSPAPALVVPSPDADSSMSVVFGYTENVINAKRAGITFAFQLIHTPARSERLLEIAAKTAVTNADGFASISLISGLRYRVSCPDLGLDKPFTPTGPTFNLLTLL